MKTLRIILIALLVTGGAYVLWKAIDRTDEIAVASRSLDEIYDDRLVAANYVYQINDLLHRKRVIVEKLEQVNSVVLAEESMSLTPKLEELFIKYPLTKLTRNEKEVFADLGDLYTQLVVIEKGQQSSYEARDKMRFLIAESLSRLQILADIQMREGQALASVGQTAVSSSEVSSHLEWSVLVVGLLAFIFAMKKLGPRVSGLPAGRPYAN